MSNKIMSPEKETERAILRQAEILTNPDTTPTTGWHIPEWLRADAKVYVNFYTWKDGGDYHVTFVGPESEQPAMIIGTTLPLVPAPSV